MNTTTIIEGEVMDQVHISLFGYEIQTCDEGAMLSLSISRLQEYLDNDTAYYPRWKRFWRLVKSFENIFKQVSNIFRNKRP